MAKDKPGKYGNPSGPVKGSGGKILGGPVRTPAGKIGEEVVGDYNKQTIAGMKKP